MLTHQTTVPNFRELGEEVGLKPGLLFRSSNPWNCTEAEAHWLLNQVGIKRIHDLRTPFEREQTYATESKGPLYRCVQEQNEDQEQDALDIEQESVRVLRVPLLNQSAMQRYVFFQADWKTRLLILGIAVGVVTLESVRHRINPLISKGGLKRMYESIVDDCRPEMKMSLESMLETNGLPCIIHCTSGKDRTGVLSALILCLCGVDDATILENYHETEKFKVELFMNVESPTVAHFTTEEMISAPKEIMQGVLNKIRKDHGSVERYIDVAVGLGREKRMRLVSKLKLQRPKKSTIMTSNL